MTQARARTSTVLGAFSHSVCSNTQPGCQNAHFRSGPVTVTQAISPKKCDKVVMDKVQPVSIYHFLFSISAPLAMWVHCPHPASSWHMVYCKDTAHQRRWQKMGIAYHQPLLSVLPAALLLALPWNLQHQTGWCPQPLAPGRVILNTSWHHFLQRLVPISKPAQLFPIFLKTEQGYSDELTPKVFRRAILTSYMWRNTLLYGKVSTEWYKLFELPQRTLQ